jgi:hypothetical protein
MVSTPGVGDVVYLSQALAKMSFYGVVTSPDSPDLFSASMELSGDQGVVTMPVLTGSPGPAGQPCFALRLQTDLDVNDVSDLPTTLTNTEADIGKYFLLDDLDGEGNIVGSSAYIWFGQAWRRMMMGSPGPAGPVPIITPSVELIDPAQTSTIVTGGSSYQPSWRLKLAVPPGPPGPSATIASAPDTDFTSRPPEPGDVLGFVGDYTDDGEPMWKPVSISALIPSPYSVPQSAFQSLGTISPQAPIGTFTIPPQPFPWTPVVWGHMRVGGFQLNLDPFVLGCEVRLGNQQAGILVARGFGSTFGAIHISPHYSTPSAPSAAISPFNGRAVVPANHSNPAQGTLYINLSNDGVVGAYNFNNENAQLFVMVVPISDGSDLTRDFSGEQLQSITPTVNRPDPAG